MMQTLWLAIISAADPITPDTSVAMPVSVFWGGVVCLLAVAGSLITITIKVVGIHGDIRMELDRHDTRLDGLEDNQEKFSKRVDHHSDLIDELRRDSAVIQTKVGITSG